ncbi:MAG: hypothetical protein EPN40_13760 [Rhodanobacteraceae bacterium]|nr:MAG: hypothetical protein EPN40_13760 [Rhodanobacteraceae bacterium]
MSRFVRNFGIDCILLLALAIVLMGIARLAGAAPRIPVKTAHPAHSGPGTLAGMQDARSLPRRIIGRIRP